MKKRLVLCYDGTWNTPGMKTNVYCFFSAVDEGNSQAKKYIAGVGTRWYDHLRGGVLGEGIDRNIKEGYRWLAEQYSDDGDAEIFLVGFSRGAYTARSLAGLIRNCGLLKPDCTDRIDEAYELYRDRQDGIDSERAKAFRDKYAREVRIRFLGVWDTVGALGVPLRLFRCLNEERYRFHDTKLSGLVDNAAHAIAIDEHRKIYDAALWSSCSGRCQDVEQRWFIGAHADVGGGYADRRLSDITLHWMMKKASDCGLSFAVPMPVLPPKNYMCNLTDSYSSFLRGAARWFTARFYRPMDLRTGSVQVLDDSVSDRYRDDPKYRPLNKVFEIMEPMMVPAE